MKLKKLCKRTLLMWILRNVIIIAALFVVYCLLLFFSVDRFSETALTVTRIASAVIALWLIVEPFLRYHFYRYGYNEKRIVISHGIIFRHEVVIPVCQIQDLHRYEGPVMLIFSISGIIFSTAGSNFSMCGLSKEDAIKTVSDLEAFLNLRIEEKRNEKV